MSRVRRIQVKPTETVIYTETLKDTAGDALNLAAATGTCAVAATLGGASIGAGSVDLTDGATGVAVTTIPDTVTALFDVGSIYYSDSKITDASGNILFTSTLEMETIRNVT